MQRTFLLGGQDGNTLLINPASLGPYYGPLGGIQPLNPLQTAVTGNGCYSYAALSGVLSGMRIFVGYVNAALALTAKVNVGGSSPAAGNISVTSFSTVQNSTSFYYYDATDIDAIVSGQTIGLQVGCDRTGSGQASLSHVNVVCDSPSAGWCSPIMWSGNGPQIYNGSRHYTNIMGANTFPASGTPGAAQGYTAQSFVASYLQWQTGTGNADTTAATNCRFQFGSTWGSPGNSSLNATVAAASYVGAQYDLTDIAAVPAGSYIGFDWTGGTSGNTLKVANAGVHIRPAGNNSAWIGSGGSTQAWPNTINPTYCPFAVARFDSEDESGCPIPTAGVFSNLAAQIQVYNTATTYTLQTYQATNDNGAYASFSATAGFSNTGPSISFNTGTVAPCWGFDFTDIAAVIPSQTMLVALTATVASGVSIACQSANFTCPAHLGLLAQGAG